MAGLRPDWLATVLPQPLHAHKQDQARLEARPGPRLVERLVERLGERLGASLEAGLGGMQRLRLWTRRATTHEQTGLSFQSPAPRCRRSRPANRAGTNSRRARGATERRQSA